MCLHGQAGRSRVGSGMQVERPPTTTCQPAGGAASAGGRKHPALSLHSWHVPNGTPFHLLGRQGRRFRPPQSSCQAGRCGRQRRPGRRRTDQGRTPCRPGCRRQRRKCPGGKQCTAGRPYQRRGWRSCPGSRRERPGGRARQRRREEGQRPGCRLPHPQAPAGGEGGCEGRLPCMSCGLGYRSCRVGACLTCQTIRCACINPPSAPGSTGPHSVRLRLSPDPQRKEQPAAAAQHTCISSCIQ